MDWLAFIYSFAGSVLFMTIVFFAARSRNRYDVIDIAWGMTFIVIAIISFMSQPWRISAQLLVVVLVAVWGLRLAAHINGRWSASSSEDKRYVTMREQYTKKRGGIAINMYVRVFIVQAVLAATVAMPVIVLNASHFVQLSWISFTGLLIWLVGFIFESVGDLQLKNHLKNSKNKGKLMTWGLWKYTRHPNYFGEITQWWGIFIIALAAPLWQLSIIGPIVITILLVFISGVPMTEKHFTGRPGWDEYKRRTSKLFPLLPRS
ncbi:DUF1295 domain-containing protein [bacterium]|nr:MAG: DUF1295 domain-containing protein [bacterium]